ncbi:MAG TPA: DUF1566 domain-containing protein [bacterium]|nr:DUF1566 domain-containing protein [bacterium]
MKNNLIFLIFMMLPITSCNITDTGNPRKYSISDNDILANDSDETVVKITCPDDNKFCHEHDGLFWSDISSNNKMYWIEAINYCENLGGRLPTISELRTLVENCDNSETGGVCRVTDDCLSLDCWSKSLCYSCEDGEESGKYSAFGDKDLFWSVSEVSDGDGATWCVLFFNGNIDFGSNTDNGNWGNARCLH